MDSNKNKTEDRHSPKAGQSMGTSNPSRGEAPPTSKKVVDSKALKPGVSSAKVTGEKKEIPEAKRRYRNRRSAFGILEKWAATPEGQLTEQQRKSVAWARATVGCGSSEGGHVSKRQRSQDEIEAADSKRAKLATEKSGSPKAKLFSDVLREHSMVLAVIDESQEDGSITGEKWRLVYNALNLNFLRVLEENPGPPPSCRDAGWFQGRVKLTACSDQRSIDLYKKAVAKVGEVWPGARISAVSREEIPSRPRARVWLPSEPANPKDALRIIQASNPDLPTGNWKIVKQEVAKGGSILTIMVINRESLAPLARTKGVIDFGFGSVTLNVYKKDGVGSGEEGHPDRPPIAEEAIRSHVADSQGEDSESSDLGLGRIHLVGKEGDLSEGAGQPVMEVVEDPSGEGARMTSIGGRGGETEESGTSPDTGK